MFSFSNKIILSFKYTIFMLCLFIYAYTYSLYEEPTSESCIIDYTHDADYIVRGSMTICYAHDLYKLNYGISEKIWYCDDGYILYDHTGVKTPWNINRR